MKADLERTFKNGIKELHEKMKKLESLSRDLESRVEDGQTQYGEELKKESQKLPGRYDKSE